MTAAPSETLDLAPAPVAGGRAVDYAFTYLASSDRRPVLTRSTADVVQMKSVRARQDSAVLALVADRYRDDVAALPVQEDGPRVGEMLHELKGLSRARRRASRRLLGRG